MIEINNLTTVSVDNSFLKKIAQIVLRGEKKQGSLSFVLIVANKMRALNKKHRAKNRVTDVLSFGDSKKFPDLPEKELGEILICLSEVKKNAKKSQTVFEKELANVLIHGILHLLGYKHGKAMEKKQEHYLLQIKF